METVYEDISITSEFKIDNILPEFSEEICESKLKVTNNSKTRSEILTIMFCFI